MKKHTTARSEMFLSPRIRGAYFYLDEMRTTDSNKKPLASPRYEFTGFIPKTGPAETCPNYGLFAKMAMDAVSKCPDFGGQFPAGANWPIQDGDDPVKLAKNPARKGNWIIKFIAHFKPTVQIVQNGVRVDVPSQRVGPTEIYKSGDYLHVSTYAFTYDNNSKGVSFDIKGVVFVGAGEAIGAVRPTADQMFAGLPGVAASGSNVVPFPTAAPQPSQAPQPNPAPAAYAAPAPTMAPQPSPAPTGGFVPPYINPAPTPSPAPTGGFVPPIATTVQPPLPPFPVR